METEHSDDCTQSNPTGYQTPLDKNVLQAFIEGMVPDEEDRLGNVAARVLMELTPLLERLCVLEGFPLEGAEGNSIEEEPAGAPEDELDLSAVLTDPTLDQGEELRRGWGEPSANTQELRLFKQEPTNADLRSDQSSGNGQAHSMVENETNTVSDAEAATKERKVDAEKVFTENQPEHDKVLESGGAGHTRSAAPDLPRCT